MNTLKAMVLYADKRDWKTLISETQTPIGETQKTPKGEMTTLKAMVLYADKRDWKTLESDTMTPVGETPKNSDRRYSTTP